MKIKNLLKGFLKSNNFFIRFFSNLCYVIFVDNPIAYFIRFAPWIDDKVYVKRMYKSRFHRELNLDNPVTFNEKNNWRKIYDRQPIYTVMVDKYLMKKFVSERVGESAIVPLLGVWDNANEIDFSSLPDNFVLKVNHAGGVIVCREKSLFDKKKAVKELNKNLKYNYYYSSREWPYKNVDRKIICEKYIGENLTDYKIYCFNGKVAYTFVWENKSREDGRKPEPLFVGAYDDKWERTEIELNYLSVTKNIEKPLVYEKMKIIAERLSENIPFIRVDCYIVNNNIYVGEMTFFPWGGFMKFKDYAWDVKLGNLEEI